MLQYSIKKYKLVHFTCFVNEIERQAIFFIFNTNPRFPPHLLYVRCKSGVTFIRRSFRDGKAVHVSIALRACENRSSTKPFTCHYEIFYETTSDEITNLRTGHILNVPLVYFEDYYISKAQDVQCVIGYLLSIKQAILPSVS